MPDAAGPLNLFLAVHRDPGDEKAWEALLEVFYPQFRKIAIRLARQYGLRSAEDVKDLTQEPVLKLSRQIGSVPREAMRTEVALGAYLRAMAANAIRDSLRARFAEKRGEMDTVHLEDRLPELVSGLPLERAEASTLLRQIDELLEAAPRDRSVFWLYFRQGFTAKEIGKIPSLKLSTEGVESVIHRLVGSIRSRLERRAAGREASDKGN